MEVRAAGLGVRVADYGLQTVVSRVYVLRLSVLGLKFQCLRFRISFRA